MLIPNQAFSLCHALFPPPKGLTIPIIPISQVLFSAENSLCCHVLMTSDFH